MSASLIYVVDGRRRALTIFLICLALTALLIGFDIVYFSSLVQSANSLELPLFPGLFAVLSGIGFFRGYRVEFYEDRIRIQKRHLPLEDVLYSSLILGPLVQRGNTTTFTIAPKPGYTPPDGGTFRVALINRSIPSLGGKLLYEWVYSKVYAEVDRSVAPALDYARYGPRKRSFLYAGIICLVLWPVLWVIGIGVFWTMPATPVIDATIGLVFVLAGVIIAGIGVVLLRYRPRLHQEAQSSCSTISNQ